MSLRYRKTTHGRAEIRERRHPLSRPARNLLLIVDESRRASEWLGMVAGLSAADFEALLQAGLIEPVNDAPSRAAPPPGPDPAALQLDRVPFTPLYDYLTAQARPRLGLMAGYRAVMDIERCSGPEALRGYALRFIDLVRQAQGEPAAREVARALAALAA